MAASPGAAGQVPDLSAETAGPVLTVPGGAAGVSRDGEADRGPSATLTASPGSQPAQNAWQSMPVAAPDIQFGTQLGQSC